MPDMKLDNPHTAESLEHYVRRSKEAADAHDRDHTWHSYQRLSTWQGRLDAAIGLGRGRRVTADAFRRVENSRMNLDLRIAQARIGW